MLMSDGEIRLAVANGELTIDPPLLPGDERLQPASIDLTLDAEIRLPKDSVNRDAITVDIANLKVPEYIEESTDLIDIAERGGLEFGPGDFVIGKTAERVSLSERLSGRVEGRSRLARLGIGVHITAPKIDPGFHNHITLEIFHLGKTRVRLSSGMTICTLLVERLGHPAGESYRGIFQGQ